MTFINKTCRRGTAADASGTSLIGEVDVSYDRLVSLLGPPDPGDGYAATPRAARWATTKRPPLSTPGATGGSA